MYRDINKYHHFSLSTVSFPSRTPQICPSSPHCPRLHKIHNIRHVIRAEDPAVEERIVEADLMRGGEGPEALAAVHATEGPETLAAKVKS